MKNKGTKQKSKKKGGDDAFGCDLTEHLRSSGRDVPQVLKKCAEFIEEHGVVDGIYRLSGVTSNIQRLRQEFCSDSCPDLTKEVYLQDIHCVGSLCKLYFRELPNPLLTYELYSKFTEAASVQGSHDKLLHIQSVIKELPIPHFRTLEYLTKHLTRLATLSTQTNMHTRNLALVWAPNLLRCKDTDASSCNGDLAFQEVRVQQSVVEFILNHTEQLFNDGAVDIKPKEGMNVGCGEKYATLPLSSQCGPMKLMSLEEAQARSLGPNHPVHKERQRENSLPDTSTATLYHTVIDVDSKRKLSGKSKWKSIFNLGKSVTDSKGKLSRNGSVFIRGQSMTEKAALRPARSMESLCSLPIDDDRPGNISPPSGTNGLFRPEVKSRTLGSDLLYDLSEEDQKWEFKGKNGGSGGGGDGGGGAMGGCSPGTNQQEAAGSSSGTTQKALPEQLKVFKGEDLGGYKPTSPKNRRMLYSGSSSHSNSSRPSFPGSFFPLESSPRHQRKAVNISEPFAVSVPLRVSAVISSNSTPCRGHAKEKPNAVALKPCKETTLPERSGGGGSSSAVPRPEVENQIPEGTSKHAPADSGEKGAHDGQAGADFPQLEPKDTTRKELLSHPVDTQTNIQSSPVGKESWSDLHQELKITEPEIDRMDETFKPIFSCEDVKTQAGVQSRRSCSSPTLSLLHGDPASNAAAADLLKSPVSNPVRRPPSESDVPLPFQLNADFVLVIGESEGVPPPRVAVSKDEKPTNLQQVLKMTPADTEKPADSKHWDLLSKRTSLHIIEQHPVPKPLRAGEHAADKASSLESTTKEELQTHVAVEGDAVGPPGGEKKHEAEIRRAARPLEDRPSTLELHHRDEDDGCAELDLVEPWEDLSSSKQWVTSPLHSPDIEVTLLHLPGPASHTLSREEGGPASHEPNADGPARTNDRLPSGNVSQTPGVEPGAKGTCSQPSSARCNRTDGGATQPHAGRCGAAKHRGTLPSQRFYRQMSQEPPALERRDEACYSKHRPCSLNLDIGRRSIRDISNQQSSNPVESSPCPRGPPTASGAANNGLSLELELFLRDRQAPLRRNSAPVSVSSVRTAFMIKTCQAKAVPVIPPKVQYSQIPHFRLEKDLDVVREQERAYPKKNTEKTALPHKITDLREELENKEPVSSSQTQISLEKSGEPLKTGPAPDLQVKTRKHTANVDLFVDCPRPSRGNLLQRSSFRNRQRPQSLILLSPPFPIMDYPPLDDSKLHLSPRSLADASAINAFSREMAENLRSPDGITLQNKMTIPKSGQRLETSTSCFYQPQRRSMIFDSRSHRQIE